ncbi:hypothetical protein EV182_001801, partial [Spiromyces aspiralis]
GHTAEMLGLLKGVDMTIYRSRMYVVGSNDTLSLEAAKRFEQELSTGQVSKP